MTMQSPSVQGGFEQVHADGLETLQFFVRSALGVERHDSDFLPWCGAFTRSWWRTAGAAGSARPEATTAAAAGDAADDASSETDYAQLVEQESTRRVMAALKQLGIKEFNRRFAAPAGRRTRCDSCRRLDRGPYRRLH